MNDKLWVLTMWSISFATRSKSSNTSPPIISLVKSTFHNISTWRMTRFSVCKKDNKNKHEICKWGTRKRDVLLNVLSLSVLFRPLKFGYSFGWKYFVVIQNSIPGSEYELGSPLLNRLIFKQLFFFAQTGTVSRTSRRSHDEWLLSVKLRCDIPRLSLFAA